ncbi:MAG: aldehyde dehydrogenase family protein, partial [Candidatus Adiutrix sp.]|nr:aldehyde dehydrogenase family protein [Candidatus Adiutrix sp.]
FAPHPKTQKCTAYVVEKMRQALGKYGAPEDLILSIENPTVEMTGELMRQADLVVATGGAPMVKAAYSSGTPAYGAGAGNSNVVVDETAEVENTAKLLINSKLFDQSSGCSCENAAVINEKIYEAMLAAFKGNGAHLLNAEEKAKLQKVLWPNWPKDHVLGRDVILQKAPVIAERAGFSVPPGTKLLLVEETGSGPNHPFSGEKLSVVLTLYKYEDFDQAMSIVRANQEYQGLGHSCGIHSFDDEKIMRYAMTMRSTRVAVRQAMTASNSGSWTSGNNWTSTLGCGTWGGNIVAENITVKHFMNYTWIARPIEPYIPTEEELFAGL